MRGVNVGAIFLLPSLVVADHAANRATRFVEAVTCSTSQDCPERDECVNTLCTRVQETADVVLQDMDTTAQCATPNTPPVDEGSIIAAALQASGGSPTPVRTSDFSSGVLEITESGYYKFMEDVSIPWTNDFSEKAAPRHLGQTVGIRVTAQQDIVIDLNGFTLQMSEDANKHEVFMNLIQLNNNNFPEGALGYGPLTSANRVLVFSSAAAKGVLKRATHFCIAGMQNRDVIIRNLDISQCEIGGISITDVRNLVIDSVVVDNSQVNIRWIPYFAVVVQLRARLHQIFARVVADASTSDISLAEWQNMRDFADEKVNNPRWVASPATNRVSGNSFGIQVKNFVRREKVGANNVRISNTEVKNIMVRSSEMTAIRGRGETVLMDVDRSAFEWDHFFTSDGARKNCGDDFCVAAQRLNKMRLEVSRYFCSSRVINNRPVGVSCTPGLFDALTKNANHRPVTGLDVRAHIPSGAFGIRFVGVTDALLDGVTIRGVDNSETTSPASSSMIKQRVSPVLWRGKDHADMVFKGAMAYGFYGERCNKVHLRNVRAIGVQSAQSSTIGIGAGDDSKDIIFDDIAVNIPSASEVGQITLPNIVPIAMSIFLEEGTQCAQFVRMQGTGVVMAPVVDCETQGQSSALCQFIEDNVNAPTTTTTQAPTIAPTAQPTAAPTQAPTIAPTAQPTAAPTQPPASTVYPPSYPTSTTTAYGTTQPPRVRYMRRLWARVRRYLIALFRRMRFW